MNLAKVINDVVSPAMFSQTLFEAACRKSLFVFNYHEVSNKPSQFSRDFNLNVRPEILAKQLVWIKKYFNVITPHQLVTNDFELPAALITFDDGFRSAFTEAAALLRGENLPATVFMNMAVVGGEPFWAAVVTYLCRYSTPFRRCIAKKYRKQVPDDFFLYCTKKDVQECCLEDNRDVLAEVAVYHAEFAREADLARSAANGMYLGNHLFNHYNAAGLSPAQLKEQYERNHASMAKYGNRVSFFSYPFGQPVSCYNEQTDALLLSLGATRLFTAFPLPNTVRDATRLHRTSMFDYIDDEWRFRSNCLVPALLNQTVTRRRYSYV